MNKKDIYNVLETKANGLEETCLGLHHGNSDLSESDIEYIFDALEDMTEAVKDLVKINTNNKKQEVRAHHQEEAEQGEL